MTRSAGPLRLLAALLLAGGATRAPAQAGGAVVLEVRPRVGDQLRLRVDQTIEIGVGTRAGDDPATTDVTSLVLLARLDVTAPEGDDARLRATADSVRVTHAGPFASTLLQRARTLQGQQFGVRLSPDGATAVDGGEAWADAALGALLAQVPGSLPHAAVAPGATWARTLEVPLAAAPGAGERAVVTGTFRFDSLSRSGEFAYLSMRGRLQRREVRHAPGPPAPVQTSGTVSTTLLLDRRRGWVVDARTTVLLRSLLGSGAAGRAPVRVRMLMTQWVRAL